MDTIPPFNIFIQIDESDITLKDNTPLCMMNILNKPILFYQLEFFERYFFREVFLITPQKFSFLIYTLISKYKGSLKPQVIVAKEDTFEELNILELICKKVTKSNFIILKSDILPDFQLSNLIDFHLCNANLLTFPLVKSDHPNKSKLSFYGKDNSNVSCSKQQVFGLQKENYYSYIDDNDNSMNAILNNMRRVVYSNSISPNSDLDSFCISKDLLSKLNRFKLEYTYKDAEFYIFHKSIFKIYNKIGKIISNDEMISLRYQFIPLLINKSYSKKIKKLLKDELINDKDDKINQFKENNQINKENLFSFNIYSCLIDNNCYKIDCFSRIINIINEIQLPIPQIQQVFFPTINNNENFLNQYKSEIYNNILNKKNPLQDLPEVLKMISLDSVIGKNILFNGYKCKITKSIIGENMVINDGSKIQLSIILDNCEIGNE